MTEAFVQQRSALSNTRVDLRLLMSSTGIWKQDAQAAQLDTVVEVATCFLLLFSGVDPAAANLKFELLREFEIVWREVIDPFLSTDPSLSKNFSGGGHLFPELLGPESHATLNSIRANVIRARKEAEEAGNSRGTSVSVAQ
jgi:hypothetical protein